jgi:hypothetical protein
MGVSRIFDFLIWSDVDLHNKTGISYRLIEETKNSISLDRIKTLLGSKSVSISLLNENLVGKKWESILQSELTIQELYYSLPYSTNKIESVELSRKAIASLNEIFQTPISMMPQIKSSDVAKLRSNGVQTFIDFISWSREDLATITGSDKSLINQLFTKFPKFETGMPVINLGVLSQTELKILKSKEYKTVEDVYFRANKETFGIMGVKWKTIERYQRMLETPVAMLQLSSSSKERSIRITHLELERLAENGIDQVIKLVYWDNNELKSILDMSVDQVNELKQSVAIKEQGMPLEKVGGYNRKTISTLLGYGIETVEDLYFSASEDMLDEEDELEWDYVKKAMEALDLPITFLDGVISSKYIEKLAKRRIDTILRFLITSIEELSEILNTPMENIENFRAKINLINLRESTETSVSILEGIPRKQLNILAEEQIYTIFDSLTTDDERLANLLDIGLNLVTDM